MQTHVRTVLNLFETKRRYIVPMYQRQYVWSLEKQWRPLWEDIETKVIERLRWNEKLSTSDARDKRDAEENPPTEHFLGAIVLDLHRTFGDEVFSQLVIDGQQRLTTCQIFLAALRDAARQHNIQDYLSELDGYVANKGVMADPQIEKLHTIGNLTLLTGSLNTIATNHPAGAHARKGGGGAQCVFAVTREP
jgi:uncharacterized protein with ParB-like and HNH nuclease domain